MILYAIMFLLIGVVLRFIILAIHQHLDLEAWNFMRYFLTFLKLKKTKNFILK